MAHKLRRKAQQHLRERTARHQFSGKNEERHGHQRKAVDAREHFLEDDQLRIAPPHKHRNGRSDRQRKRDGKAQHHQHHQANNQCQSHCDSLF